MKAKNTIKESRTDWNKLKAMPDSNIDFSDVPKLDKDFFSQAQVRMPKKKKAISLRLDPDVLDWFKREEKQYQTKINAVLRAYVEAHKHG
ncbi:MAG: BrnA antitoxin family protein [Verrucomicrobia bacterium]|nr:BrnA antitoxin family protein [Verrucomicrobiota bacterium]MDA1088234.1 BrnA antitoxin family protein [Verrucomicrobiota bacterium]